MKSWTYLLILGFFALTACGRGGNIEGSKTSKPPTHTPTSPTLTGVVSNKQFIGGAVAITGTGGGQTYSISIGMNHYENLTLSGGGYSIIIGGPKEVLSQ